MSYFSRFILVLLTLPLFFGCEVFPTTRLKPALRNPFPQLTEIAVVPFFDRTQAQNINGDEFAQAYASELQRVPGFNVMSVQAVKDVMEAAKIRRIQSVDDVRTLARLLGADVVVLGHVNEYSSYYPQKLSLKVDWYAANPYFHAIPNGYGLPWGTDSEIEIPARIVDMAQHDLARIQLKTQTPPDPNGDADHDALMSQMLLQRQIEAKARELGISPEQLLNKKPADEEESDLDEDADPKPSEFELRQTAAIREQLRNAGVPNIDNETSETPSSIASLLEESDGRKQRKSPAMTAWSLRNRNEDVWKSMQPRSPKKPAVETPPNPGIQSAVQNAPMPQYYAYPMPMPMPQPMPPYPVYPQPMPQYSPYPVYQQPMPMPAYQQPPNMPPYGQPQIEAAQPANTYWDKAPTEETEPEPMYDFRGQAPKSGMQEFADKFPAQWPDARGFVPQDPQLELSEQPIVNNGPVLTHTAIYNANDSEFTQALSDYDLLFRDDKRVTGWQTVLSNRGEFIAFCCRLHIWETFMTRGGAANASQVKRLWKPWKGDRPY